MERTTAADSSGISISSGETLMRMTTLFPIPPSSRGKLTIRHPYFTLTPYQMIWGKQVTLQWQIHPAKDGSKQISVLFSTLLGMLQAAVLPVPELPSLRQIVIAPEQSPRFL